MHTMEKSGIKDKGNTSTSTHPTFAPSRKQVRATNDPHIPLDVRICMEHQLDHDPLLIQQVNQENQRAHQRGAAAQRQEANKERPVGDYITPNVGNYDSPINVADGEGYDFDIKGGLAQMVKSDQFGGIGNPHYDSNKFTEMCIAY